MIVLYDTDGVKWPCRTCGCCAGRCRRNKHMSQQQARVCCEPKIKMGRSAFLSFCGNGRSVSVDFQDSMQIRTGRPYRRRGRKNQTTEKTSRLLLLLGNRKINPKGSVSVGKNRQINAEKAILNFVWVFGSHDCWCVICMNDHIKLAVRAIKIYIVPYAACKYEFRRNPRSHR